MPSYISSKSMKAVPYILSLTLGLGFVSDAFSAGNSQNGLSVLTCTGRIIIIDLGEDTPPVPPPHKLKPCHAVCCSKEMDSESEESDLA